MDLAGLTDGRITAIDNHQPFINGLNNKISKAGLNNKIKTVNKDMFHLDFEKESFDLIWAEGAIYIIGFENGLKTWKKFLKKYGYIVVTELTWLKSNPPEEVRKFWDEEYPGMQDVESNIKIINGAGYKLQDYFVLPNHSWWDDYYIPLENRIKILKEKYKDNLKALETLNIEQLEIDLYRKYSNFYGYIFYIMRLT